MDEPLRTWARDDLRETGVLLRRDLLIQGWHHRAIDKAVREGSLARVRHGAYASGPAWAQMSAAQRYVVQCRAVLQASKTTQVLSHTSAAAVYAAPLWGQDLTSVHVTRTDGLGGRHEAGVHQHCGRFEPADLAVVNGLPVMTPARTAVEVTLLGRVEPALVVVNHLLNTGLLTKPQLASRAVDFEQVPGSRITDLVIRLADARIASVGETRVDFLCFRNGLPRGTPQVPITDERGVVVAVLDFAWPELGVFLEFDGLVKYEQYLRPGERASDAVVREKRREDLVRRLTGWRCIRVTWADLVNPAALIALLRSALAVRAA